MRPSPSIAQVTHDGVITKMGQRQAGNTDYKMDVFGLQMKIPLRGNERSSMHYLRANRGAGTVRFVVRSCIAQLGVDAFKPEVTDVFLNSDHMVVDTLVTNYSTEEGNQIIEALQAVAKSKQAKFARAAILPERAALNRQRIDDALAARTIRAPGAQAAETKTADVLSIPLERSFHYMFDYGKLSHDQLMAMIFGKGRDILSRARPLKEGLPTILPPHGFFVGAMHVQSPKYHLVLEEQTMRNGEASPLVHGQSCFLDQERTGKEGPVQVELRNINGTPETLSDLSMCARVFVAEK